MKNKKIEMGHLLITHAFNRVEGIGVDVHVHRISNRLEWVENTKGAEETRKSLEKWLPKDLWDKINYLLVGFGQSLCTPRNPKCESNNYFFYIFFFFLPTKLKIV